MTTITTKSSYNNGNKQTEFQSRRRNSRRKSKTMDNIEEFEQTILYKLIHNIINDDNIFLLWNNMDKNDLNIRQKSLKTGNGYIHELILMLTSTKTMEKDKFKMGIILLYKLALLGCDINLQNLVGNTVLHIACFRPHGVELSKHLLRLGCDPCLENKQGYRIFVDVTNFECYLVKGQANSYCSVWQAVQKEDFQLLERFMKSWFRVNSRRKRKSMLDVAYDTSNYAVVDFLNKYNNTNELVVACYACDIEKVQEFSQMRFDEDTEDEPTLTNKPDFHTNDQSGDIHKPLLSAMLELAPYTNEIIEILKKLNIGGHDQYQEQLEKLDNQFENCPFHQFITDGSLSSLEKAWDLIHTKQVPLKANSNDGDTYLHLVVYKYCSIEDLQIKRYLIRIIHKLALAGINVNHRNNKGETALITAFRQNADRPFMDYLINIGIDTSYRCRLGQCVMINTYATRGQLMLSNQSQRQHLPGLWPAVEDNNAIKVKYWLNNLCRVNSVKGGRNPLQYAKDCGYTEIVDLLSKHFYLSEFAISSLAGDTERMKHCLAMGQGSTKVNAAFSHYFAGLTDDWKVEHVVRPILISVMEICTAAIVHKFIKYEVNLNTQYEEVAPCAPIAFWPFRDDISEDISIVVAQHADLTMRDERGSTLLHKAVTRKGNLLKKKELISILLERQANVAARDLEKRTPRDCCDLQDVQNGDVLRQLIDDHVLTMVYEENHDGIEELILQGYEHITDIRGTARQKNAEELARLRYNKELIELLNNIDEYQAEVRILHAAIAGDCASLYTRFLGEKKVAWGVDSRHRNILHIAVLYKHAELVSLICDQFPQLINQPDVLLRSPIHYAVSLRDQRKILSIISTSNSVNLQVKDANNLSALDYGEEIENPTPIKSKSRGRRIYNYTVRDLVSIEKEEAIKEMTTLPEKIIKEITQNGHWRTLENKEEEENKDGTFVTKLAERAHTVA